MIRFAVLQSRTQTLIAMLGLAAVAVVLALTGPDLVHLYDTIIAPCAERGDCSQTTISTFLQNHNNLRRMLDILVIVAPCIIGVFWGAPLVARELEGGTYRLAWTQSVTRTRWSAVKISVMLLASMAVAGLLTLMATWWNSPLDRVAGNAFGTFDARDIVPIGYAAFGFALGVAAGVFIRRTVPTMATVLFLFTAARVSFTQLIRPHLIAPLRLTLGLDARATGFGRTESGLMTMEAAPPDIPNAWIQSVDVVDKAGHRLTADILATTCPRLSELRPPSGVGGDVRVAEVPKGTVSIFEECVTKVSATYHRVVTYHPGSRYWAFQWYETAIYLGAALVLAGLCVWTVHRRRS